MQEDELMKNTGEESVQDLVAEATSKDTPLKSKKKFIIAGIVAVLLILYVGISVYFMSHFYFRTVINGVDCSGKTVEEAKELLASNVEEYEMKIVLRGDKTETLVGSDFDLKFISDNTIDVLMGEKTGFGWPLSLFKQSDYEFDALLEYDESKFNKCIANLECMDVTKFIESEDAAISNYSPGKGYEIKEEVYGTAIDKMEFYDVVENALLNLNRELILEETECYDNPKFTKDSPEVKEALEVMNKYIEAEITLNFGSQKEVVDYKLIDTWLKPDSSYEIIFDKMKIKEYLNELSEKYDTLGKVRTFATSYGANARVSGGNFGWSIDHDKEMETLMENIQKGEKVTRDIIWKTKGVSHGTNDYGNSYVEINLTAQHLFLYSNGARIMDTPIITGNPNLGNATPPGTYRVTYKTSPARLKGPDWDVLVTYWMPFNDDIGMHDCYWHQIFGGNVYNERGSHGCVNIPEDKAAIIYSYVYNGYPVIVYNLPGTETEETDFTPEEEKTEGSEEGGETTPEEGENTTPEEGGAGTPGEGEGATPDAGAGEGQGENTGA